MEKKIEVCIGTDRHNCIQVRLSLMIVDGETVLSEHYHRVNIEPGQDVEEQRKRVEEHIAAPTGGVPGAPWPPIPDEEWQKVTGTITAIHTPERVEKFSKRKVKSHA